jgi:hypothetical protein
MNDSEPIEVRIGPDSSAYFRAEVVSRYMEIACCARGTAIAELGKLALDLRSKEVRGERELLRAGRRHRLPQLRAVKDKGIVIWVGAGRPPALVWPEVQP